MQASERYSATYEITLVKRQKSDMLFCYLLSRITISRCETVYEVWREKILPWWCLSTCWFKRRRRRGFVLAFMNRLSFVMRTWRCRNIFQGHEIFREERTSFKCPFVGQQHPVKFLQFDDSARSQLLQLHAWFLVVMMPLNLGKKSPLIEDLCGTLLCGLLC